MKVLVTGATGFIGKEIVKKLLSDKHEVVEVGSRKSTNSTDRFEGKSFFCIDISDLPEVESLTSIKNVDVVIHSAGLAHQFGNISQERFFSVNVDGTANICDLAAKLGAKHLILISSVSVYGNFDQTTDAIDETFECKPVGFYAESKRESELTAQKVCEANNIALTILRPATVIGEGDVGNVAKLIRAIDGKRFVWLGRGENSKSLIYKKDVARACLAVLDRKISNIEIFNVSAKSLKMNELVQMIEKFTNKKGPPAFVPINLVRNVLKVGLRINKNKTKRLIDTVEKWVANDVYSSAKIKKEFGFETATSIDEAIELEINWYKNEK